jgi:hypothetical protein
VPKENDHGRRRERGKTLIIAHLVAVRLTLSDRLCPKLSVCFFLDHPHKIPIKHVLL